MDTEKEKATHLTQQAIPTELPPLTGWKEIPINENGEPLVPLGPFSENSEVYTHSIYYGEKSDSPYSSGSLEGSLVTMFVRKEVADQLKLAQSLLPKGMHLIAFDTYRTLQVQQSLYDVYIDELKNQHPDWSDEKLSEKTQKFVSIPSTEPDRPSPHNTGGAVDVAIFKLPDNIEQEIREIDVEISRYGLSDWEKVYQLEMKRISLIEQNMQVLNFGTSFDYGGSEASLSYYEKLSSQKELNLDENEAMLNRRLLYNIMTNVGFEPYEDEWWHFNSKKSQMGAKVADLDHAEYGAKELSQKNQEHEKMRSGHLKGSQIIYNNQELYKLGVLPANSPFMKAAIAGVDEVGNIRDTQSPIAEIIKPQK